MNIKRFIIYLLFSFVFFAIVVQCQSKESHTYDESLAKCQYKDEHPRDTSRQQSPINIVSTPSKGVINGHEWVDLGLSVKWATCNVGATNPSDYGGYYAWGETKEKSNYTWSNCFDCLDSIGEKWDVYWLADRGGFSVNDTVKDDWVFYEPEGRTFIFPTSGHDTARENWGGTWRMPTVAELEELCRECKWTWTSRNEHNGYVVTGSNGNSIFLPAAGSREGSKFDQVGTFGIYWSNKVGGCGAGVACNLVFCASVYFADGSFNFRKNGLSVRPVTE